MVVRKWDNLGMYLLQRANKINKRFHFVICKDTTTSKYSTKLFQIVISGHFMIRIWNSNSFSFLSSLARILNEILTKNRAANNLFPNLSSLFP